MESLSLVSSCIFFLVQQVHGGAVDFRSLGGGGGRRPPIGADHLAAGGRGGSAAVQQHRVAMAGRGRRWRPQLDRPEERKRAGGHTVVAADASRGGKARHQRGRSSAGRMRQGRDGHQMRGLDAEIAPGHGRMRGRPQGSGIPGRSVQVSGRL